MKLFSEHFAELKSDEQLEALHMEFPQYDIAYLVQGAYGLRRHTKEWMESMWTLYEPYADPHFLKEFKRHFTQRSWELYLGVTLLNHGFKLGEHKSAGADFDVQDVNGERIMWIEAIAVNPGDGADRVPDHAYEVVRSIPVDEMLLRVAAALDTKHKKYLSDVKNDFVAKTEAYVIAIDRSELGHVEIPPSLILKALFGVGHQTLSFPVPAMDEPSRSVEPKRSWGALPEISKKSGNPVSMRFFENPAHAGISAVIYSVPHVINSPRLPDEMGEHFYVVHNPHAINPIPFGVLPFGEEYRVDEDVINIIRERMAYQSPDPFEYLATSNEE
ncbi:MAG: hypothetical protein JWO50_577 [Candidatus Kaiserbacteria bacterium]|nr:hypothetical protein [Candidatus Kaiserbacteria bacterium]